MDQQDKKESELIKLTPEQEKSFEKAGLLGDALLKAFEEAEKKKQLTLDKEIENKSRNK